MGSETRGYLHRLLVEKSYGVNAGVTWLEQNQVRVVVLVKV